MPAFPPHYAPLADFVAPAVGRAQLWRTLAGLVVAGLATFVLGSAFGLVLVSTGGLQSERSLQDLTQGTTPLGLVMLLFAYLPLTLAIGLATVGVAKRRMISLIGPPGAALRCFLWVAVPLLGLWALLTPLSVMDENVQHHLDIVQQLPWLPVALTGLFIQTGTEELVFRGYLQQQLAARWTSPWVWMVMPSLLFGALHYSPQEYGASALFVVCWAVLFGFAAADLTARTGNLGAAAGLHFANNAATMLLVGLSGRLDALTLYTAQLDQTAAWSQLPYLAIDTLSLLVGWLSARVILRV